MQNTRLNTLVDRLLDQLSRWLQNPWRRLSLLIISVLLGNFLATVFSTVAGQNADLDVIVAVMLLLYTEVISWFIYRGDRLRAQKGRSLDARPLLLEFLNGVKVGLIYGLFVEAFKLGS